MSTISEVCAAFGRICGMRHYVDTAKHLSAFEAGVADREERAPQYG